jgi:hypothetical protein
MLTLLAAARAMPMMIAALPSDGQKEGDMMECQKAIKMTEEKQCCDLPWRRLVLPHALLKTKSMGKQIAHFDSEVGVRTPGAYGL